MTEVDKEVMAIVAALRACGTRCIQLAQKLEGRALHRLSQASISEARQEGTREAKILIIRLGEPVPNIPRQP